MAERPDAIAAWLEAGRARYPDVVIDAATLVRQLERHAIPADVAHPHAADLYLAAACAAGDRAAIAAFDRELGPILRAAARRVDAAGDFAEEAVQVARERLLIASGEAGSRVSNYAGQGPLRAWVRVAGVRIAMNLVRDRKRDVLVGDEAFFDVISDGNDDERERTRERYGAACSEALRAAFALLTRRERHLLRMHYLHGLTVDELAPTMRVHRATVARWIASARERLLDQTRAGLRARLAIGEATVDTILRELAGKIEISVSRLLASDPAVDAELDEADADADRGSSG